MSGMGWQDGGRLSERKRGERIRWGLILITYSSSPLTSLFCRRHRTSVRRVISVATHFGLDEGAIEDPRTGKGHHVFDRWWELWRVDSSEKGKYEEGSCVSDTIREGWMRDDNERGFDGKEQSEWSELEVAGYGEVQGNGDVGPMTGRDPIFLLHSLISSTSAGIGPSSSYFSSILDWDVAR